MGTDLQKAEMATHQFPSKEQFASFKRLSLDIKMLTLLIGQEWQI